MAEFTFAPLTPASFLDRAAAVFADRTAIVDGERRFTYRDMSERCRRLAGALAAQGVGHQDRIAALCANSHVMLELHNAVPMMGAVLVTLNTRLSVEVEQVLDSHPSVVESAVVGMPHERWGEVPVAFVTLRKTDVDADALTEYARDHLAQYKAPKRFEFGELPKTSTGKIQKNVLRDQALEPEESS